MAGSGKQFPGRRTGVIVCAAACLLAAAAAWTSGRRYAAVREDVYARAERLTRAVQAARHLRDLPGGPMSVAPAAPPARDEEAIAAIEEAASQFGIKREAVSIDTRVATGLRPGPAEAPWSVRIDVSDAPAEELVRFLETAEASIGGATITELVLQPDPLGARWSASAVVAAAASRPAEEKR